MVLMSPERPLAVGGAKLRDGVANISWPESHYPEGQSPHGPYSGYIQRVQSGRGAQVRVSNRTDSQGFLWMLFGCLRRMWICFNFGCDDVLTTGGFLLWLCYSLYGLRRPALH